MHEILGSKREDRFSNPFIELVQETCQVHFSYLLRLGNFFKLLEGPADTAKVPTEVPEDSRHSIYATSDRLETWLIPSGTTRSRQYHRSTMV